MLRRAAPLLLLLAACAGPHHAARERTGIPDLEAGDLLGPDGKRVSLASFTEQARSARFILIGEAHDSACDHRTQAALLAAIAGAGLAPMLGLEMVDVDRQAVLDRFDRGELAVGDLGQALDWPHTWGVPFRLYEPVFLEARRGKVPLVALNLPRELVDRVRDDPALADPRLPPQILPPPDAQLQELKAAFEAHARMAHGHAGMAHAHAGDLDRFLRVQSLWDTQMATAALAHESAEDRRMVILAGGGHVENGWGIAHRLHVLAPGAPVLSVLPWRGDAPIPQKAADFYAYCPD